MLTVEEQRLINVGLSEIGAPRIGAWSEARLESALRELLRWCLSTEDKPEETVKAAKLLLNVLPRNIIEQTVWYLTHNNTGTSSEFFDVLDVQPLLVDEEDTYTLTEEGVECLCKNFGIGIRKKDFLVSGEKNLRKLLLSGEK